MPASPLVFLPPMKSELRPLLAVLPLRQERTPQQTLYRGTFGDSEIVAAITGIGTEAAALATERVLDAVPDAKLVVVVGIAGGLDDATAVGDLVFPEAVIDGPTGDEFTPVPAGTHTAKGKIHTSDQLVLGPDKLAELAGLGVIALDMETSAVARVCTRRGVPWSVVRSISDHAADHIDDNVMQMAGPDGSGNPVAIAKFLLTKPGRIPSLARLARGSALAAKAAAAAAIGAFASGGSAP
jgi:adenosylhomocysteine nucleosidase